MQILCYFPKCQQNAIPNQKFDNINNICPTVNITQCFENLDINNNGTISGNINVKASENCSTNIKKKNITTTTTTQKKKADNIVNKVKNYWNNLDSQSRNIYIIGFSFLIVIFFICIIYLVLI